MASATMNTSLMTLALNVTTQATEHTTLPPGRPIWFQACKTISDVIVLFATFFNCVIFIAIIRYPAVRNRVNETVISLALGDILSFINIPMHIISDYVTVLLQTNRTLCLFSYCCNYCIVILSNLNVVLMAVDRYVAIVHPFSYVKYGNSLPHIRWIIGVCWLYSFLAGFSHMIFNKWTPTSYCVEGATIYSIISQVTVLSVVAAGAVAMVILYARIFFVAVRQARTIQVAQLSQQVSGVEMNQRQKSSFSYTWVIALIVINYMVTWTPALAINYTLPYSYPRAASVSLLVVSNILLDPLIYIWKIKEFRKQFLIMLCCRRPESNNQLKPNPNVNTVVVIE